MSTNSQDQEIDLGQIGTGIKSLFNGIINSVFDFIFFVKKKIIVIGFLFVLGVVLGVLLDLNMPNVNGFQVLEFFRENDLFSKIPVSIITGVGSDELVAKAYEYPIVDVLRKPFNERDIKLIVEETVSKYMG